MARLKNSRKKVSQPDSERSGWLTFRRGVFVLLCLGILAAAFFGEAGLLRFWEMHRKIGQIEGQISTLRLENQELKGKVLHLRNDPMATERIARENLGLIRSNEWVIRFTK